MLANLRPTALTLCLERKIVIEEPRKRYSALAPLSLQQRIDVAIAAIGFFGPMSYKKNCKILKLTPAQKKIVPLSASDFIKYLDVTKILPESDRYRMRVGQLLRGLASEGLLTQMGYGGDVITPGSYYCMRELTSIEKQGVFWLTPTLGADFLAGILTESVVQIVGETSCGDQHAGTGIVVDQRHILTCAHVLRDMTVAKKQKFNDMEVQVADQFIHDSIDMAILRVSESILSPPKGLGFGNPRIGQKIYVLGYPKIPFTTSPALTVQTGEVTNEAVSLMDKSSVFLFSAIARPGNSGGPIISNSGQVVGIVSKDLTYDGSEFSPHYAGIPTSEIEKGLSSLGIDMELQIERYE